MLAFSQSEMNVGKWIKVVIILLYRCFNLGVNPRPCRALSATLQIPQITSTGAF